MRILDTSRDTDRSRPVEVESAELVAEGFEIRHSEAFRELVEAKPIVNNYEACRGGSASWGRGTRDQEEVPELVGSDRMGDNSTFISSLLVGSSEEPVDNTLLNYNEEELSVGLINAPEFLERTLDRSNLILVNRFELCARYTVTVNNHLLRPRIVHFLKVYQRVLHHTLSLVDDFLAQCLVRDVRVVSDKVSIVGRHKRT